MKLNKDHRQSLIFRLKQNLEELEASENIADKAQAQNIVDANDIKIFLLQKEIELIEQSLIDNDIDY